MSRDIAVTVNVQVHPHPTNCDDEDSMCTFLDRDSLGWSGYCRLFKVALEEVGHETRKCSECFYAIEVSSNE